MKLLSIVLLVALQLVSSQASTIKLSPHAAAHFQRLMVTYPELFTSEEGKQERLQYFTSASNKINAHNNGPDGQYFQLGHNKMSILSPEEKSRKLGRISKTTNSPAASLRAATQKPVATTQKPVATTKKLTTTTTQKPTTTTAQKPTTTTTKKPTTTTTKKPTTTKPTPPPRLKAFDLRNSACGKQIPIKDQLMECGSCWAFSTIAPIEWAQCNKTGTYTRLSEEQLVSCDDEDSGCDGGDLESAMTWILDSQDGKVATENSYPYVSGDGGGGSNSSNSTNSTTCNMGNADIVIGATLKNWNVLPCASDSGSTTINTAVTIAIENAILKYGVVAACVLDTFNDKFKLYESGVFKDDSCQKGVTKFEGCGSDSNANHCISLVGWGFDTAVNLPYWILRNEWGTEWGMDGYMHIQKGVNMCGIESQVVYATVA